MPTITFSHRIPSTPEEFESLCRELYKVHHDCPTLQRHGRRGHRQHGVDLFGVSRRDRAMYGIQCKLHEHGKKCTLAEIDEEIEKAKTFSPKLDHFIVATTAPRDPELQRHLAQVTSDHLGKDLFDVVIASSDELDELLNLYPGVANLFYPSPKADSQEALHLLKSMASNLATIIVPGAERTLSAALEALQSGKPQSALALFDQIQREPSWHSLATDTKFKVLANSGVALIALAREEEAARCFQDAAVASPEHAKAPELVILANILLDRRDQAFRNAVELRQQQPASTRAAALWIISAPADISVADLRKELDPALLDDAEVQRALAASACQAKDFVLAEEHALRAVELMPSWVDALAIAASVLVAREAIDPSSPTGAGLAEPSRERIKRAISLGMRALAALPPEGSSELRAPIKLDLARASRLLGDMEAAKRWLYGAVQDAPTDSSIITSYASFLDSEDQHSEAIALLEGIPEESRPEHYPLILALALKDRGSPEDLERAIQLLSKAISGPALPAQLAGHCTDLLLDMIDKPSSELASQLQCTLACLPSHGIAGVDFESFQALLHLRLGDTSEASRIALLAKSKALPETDKDTSSRIADVLDWLGQPQESLALWLLVAPRQRVNRYTYRLLDAARRSANTKATLELTRSLRAAGVFDVGCIDYEMAALEENNSLDEALLILEECRRLHPGEPAYSIYHALFSIRRHGSRVAIARTDVPDPTTVNSHQGRAIVHALRNSATPSEACLYAYDLLRAHKNDFEANAAMIASLLPMTGPEFTLARPTKVTADCAVEFRRKDTGVAQRIVVLPEPMPPDPWGDEYSLNHPLAAPLLDRSAGEDATLPDSLGGTIAVTVLAIMPKTVHRYQQTLDTIGTRFPEQSFVRQVPLPNSPTGALDVQPLLLELDKKYERGKELLSYYRTRKLTTFMLSRAIGISQVEVFEALIAEKGMPVYCNSGNPQEIDRAIGVAKTASTVVLDLTSIITLWKCGLLERTLRGPLTCVTSEGTIQSIQDVLFAVRTGGPSGFASKDESGYHLVEFTPEQLRARVDDLEQLMRLLEEACNVEGGLAIIELPEARRQELLEVLGRPTTECIAISLRPGHVLVADDWAIGGVAHEKLKARYCWTQILLLEYLSRGALTPSLFHGATADMALRGYDITMIDSKTLLFAGEDCRWDYGNLRFSAVMDRLSDPRVADSFVYLTASEVLRFAWRIALLRTQRDAVVRMLLERLAKRSRGVVIAVSLYDSLQELFGVNILERQAVEAIFRPWLRARGVDR